MRCSRSIFKLNLWKLYCANIIPCDEAASQPALGLSDGTSEYGKHIYCSCMLNLTFLNKIMKAMREDVLRCNLQTAIWS